MLYQGFLLIRLSFTFSFMKDESIKKSYMRERLKHSKLILKLTFGNGGCEN